MKNLKNNVKTLYLWAFFISCVGCSSSFTMEPPNPWEDGGYIDVTGAQIRKAARLVLASLCMRGDCKCPSGQLCNYIEARNRYLAQDSQRLVPQPRNK